MRGCDTGLLQAGHHQTGAVAIALRVERGAIFTLPVDQLPMAMRLANATVSFVRYLVKTVWPTDLAVCMAEKATSPFTPS